MSNRGGTSSDSWLGRVFEPLIGTLWTFLLVWTAVVAGFWLTGSDETQLTAAIANPGLRDALIALSKSCDTIWLLLATTNLYLHLAQREGLARTRRIALTILSISALIAWLSTRTGFPLGQVFYTARLGAKFGPIPLGWPLLWLVVVISARELAAQLFPRLNHGALAAVVGIIALLSDLNLEPIATKLRLYWFWNVGLASAAGSPPWRNEFTWFLAVTALAWGLREQNVAPQIRRSWRPAVVILLLNALLVAGHVRIAFQS